MRPSERTRERRALALASLLHAAAIASLAGVATTNAPLPRHVVAASAPADLEIDLEPQPTATPPELATPAAVTVAKTRPLRAPRQAAEPSAAELVEEPEPQAPDEATDEGAAEPPSDRVVDLGLGPDGWRKWATLTKPEGKPSSRKSRRGAKPFRAPPASTTGGLQEGLEARDRELGLGASGPVIGALYRAAHSDVAPQLGTAHFRVTLLSSGTVEVSLASATDQTAGWNAVAARAAEALRSSPLRIPAQREGVSMLVEITAESVFPNGLRRKDLKGPHIEAVAPRLRSTEEAQTEVERLNPTAKTNPNPQPLILDLPGVYLAQTGKICSYRLGITASGPVLSGGCDPSHIGVKAQRMVHTRVVEETTF